MPGSTLYKRIIAQLLLLCICIAAANTCPNRKFIAVETQTITVQRGDSDIPGNSRSECSEGISRNGFHEAFKTGGKASPLVAAIVFPLSFLNNAPGTDFYSPAAPQGAITSDPLPLFLKNGVLIV